MKLDLNKFYNTNYKDFVHKEAVEEALRMVAEIDLKDVEIDTILSITFSVDEYGENPIYVEYLDKEGKKHIVRIRPALTNEIQEILKKYVTLEQHENDVKVTLNDGDVVYWRKNPYQPVDLSNYYTKTESDGKYATKGEVSDIDTKTSEELGKIKTYTDTKHTEVTQHVTELENEVNKKTNSYIWDKNNELTIDFVDGNEVYYDVRDGKITKIGIKEKTGASQKMVMFDDFVKQEQLNSLNELVQELATNVNGRQIGERTKINFELSNSHNEEATNPTITKNESYYVKVGSQYVVSVYLTFNVDVTPTSTPRKLAVSMVHDIPAENPPLTLTVVVRGNKGAYTTSKKISSHINRVPFDMPAFPATEIYNSTEISIYGSAITKDLTKESEK